MITPLGNNLIVRPKPKKTQTDGGIFLPASDPTPVVYHTVVAIGKDVKDIKVGDTVYVPAGARRNSFEHDGETLCRVEASEIPFIYYA